MVSIICRETVALLVLTPAATFRTKECVFSCQQCSSILCRSAESSLFTNRSRYCLFANRSQGPVVCVSLLICVPGSSDFDFQEANVGACLQVLLRKCHTVAASKEDNLSNSSYWKHFTFLFTLRQMQLGFVLGSFPCVMNASLHFPIFISRVYINAST